jgi:Tol biopolymer transport system component
VLKTGERKTIQKGGMFPRYLPSGHLLYAREGTLFAAPFDVDRLEVTGPPAPFLEHVDMISGNGSALYDFSKTGTFLYVAGENTSANLIIDWMDKEGKFQPLRKVGGNYFDPRISPDGKRLALAVEDRGTLDIWVYDWQRDTPTRVTFGPGNSAFPVWTPDGQRIVFRSDRGSAGTANLYWVRADGTGEVEKLAEGTSAQTPFSWTPDGKFLAFQQSSPDTGFDIWILPFEGDAKSGWKPGQPRVFLNTKFTEVYPVFSPDGRWLAYMSNESGSMEVYVRPFPGPGGKWQISSGGGASPIWSKNGKELFFSTGQAPYRIMVAAYRVVGNSFQADKPQLWSSGEVLFRGNTLTYDLAPDGKRFAVLRLPENPEAAAQKNDKFVLILNVFDELRRLTAAPKK